MSKSDTTHPIYNKYNVNGEKIICSLCDKEYDSPLNISTAKNHFRSKHLNIWKDLKSVRGKNRGSRHRVYEYFSVIDSGEHQCNLCSRKYKEPHITELKYHVSHYHKEIWDTIKEKKLERGDRLVRFQENCDDAVSESSQTGFMKNDEILELDTVNISSDSDVEMDKNMKKVSLIESINMENEDTEVRIKRDEVIIKGKGKVNFFK
ncbi:15271_t:CDS:1 [Cetraspora pellucida]|uniref:15271_t:CDS:1 n=1 Tax=Cetraspora pellucida TaxID=1433469 RepID=A0A9N9IY59_9GLOM|nr:15271_t:CDS:1 [Cetraspora pellucida]